MSKITEFPSNIIQELNYYVYIYSDPDTLKPFYIGKGKGNRCFNHLFQEGDTEKIKKIQELKEQGKNPIIEILIWGVDEETALKVEAAAIDLIGIENLTNLQKGHHSAMYGRIDVDVLYNRFNRDELNREDITENVMFIKVNGYHYGMTDFQLYDQTRRSWKVNEDRVKRVEYAFAIYEGLVLEVYKIAGWFPAHTTYNSILVSEDVIIRDIEGKRFEFVGQVADDSIRKKYVGKSVTSFYKKGEQNPIKYILKEN